MQLRILGYGIEVDTSHLLEDENEVIRQVEGYLTGEREDFDLKPVFPGDFTGQVMKEMVMIPYGETRTYGDIAKSLESSAVAVGQACSMNPLPIIVPCHRVVGKNSIGGYQYDGLKEKLLALESDHGNQI